MPKISFSLNTPTHTCTDSLQYFEKYSLDPVWLLFSGLAINLCLLNKE